MIPNQKILDIALFMNYLQSLSRLPREVFRHLERIKRVVEQVKLINSSSFDKPDYILPYEQKELYLPISHGILNGLPVTLTHESNEWIIRNGTLSYNLTQEHAPISGTLEIPRSNLSRPYGFLTGHGSVFPHPNGVAVRIRTRLSTDYVKGHLVLLDDNLDFISITELWDNHISSRTQDDMFINTFAVMSVDGTTLYCLNWNQGDLSTMEYNTANSNVKHAKEVYWRHNAVDYKITNGFIMRGALAINPGFDFQLPIHVLRGVPNLPRMYPGRTFQVGFDGIHLYWNTSPSPWIRNTLGGVGYAPGSFQYVHRYKVVE